MFGMAGQRLSSRELFDILSITGGVPKYLEEIRPEWSVEENMRQLCFMPRGTLFREFDETFSAVFGRRVSSRGDALRMLADAPLSVSELARSMHKTPGGKLTQALKDLEYAGFVAKDSGLNPQTGEPLRVERYRIKDNYTRFYLRYVAPKRRAIEKGLFTFSSLEQLKGWDAMLGLQFENMILNHVEDILPHLGLERSMVLSASPYQRKSGKGVKGCQIDLLVQTERTIFVIEIKRRKEIGPSVIDEVRDKIESLGASRNLSVRTALVYDGRLSPSVEAERYFDFLVDAKTLLK